MSYFTQGIPPDQDDQNLMFKTYKTYILLNYAFPDAPPSLSGHEWMLVNMQYYMYLSATLWVHLIALSGTH